MFLRLMFHIHKEVLKKNFKSWIRTWDFSKTNKCSSTVPREFAKPCVSTKGVAYHPLVIYQPQLWSDHFFRSYIKNADALPHKAIKWILQIMFSNEWNGNSINAFQTLNFRLHPTLFVKDLIKNGL